MKKWQLQGKGFYQKKEAGVDNFKQSLHHSVQKINIKVSAKNCVNNSLTKCFFKINMNMTNTGKMNPCLRWYFSVTNIV